MITSSYNIKITSGTREFIISPTSDAHLISHDGFYSPDCDVKLSSYAWGEGGYPTKRRYGERILTLEVEICGENPAETRRRLAAMMNPESGCVIDVTAEGVHRKISAIPYGDVKFTTHTFAGIVDCEMSFVAPWIFFEGAVETLGTDNASGGKTLVNGGDVPCGIVATISASGGSVVTPTISCGGKYVKCPVTLSDGDTLVIDTRERQKKITLNGSAYYGFDAGSTFFTIPVGTSVVKITAQSGSEYITSDVRFTPLYCGI